VVATAKKSNKQTWIPATLMMIFLLISLVLVSFITNKMQSETAVLASGAATCGQTGRNIGVVFESDLLEPLCENMTSSTKPEVHCCVFCYILLLSLWWIKFIITYCINVRRWPNNSHG